MHKQIWRKWPPTKGLQELKRGVNGISLSETLKHKPSGNNFPNTKYLIKRVVDMAGIWASY